jgi:hypothetical protein
MANKNKQTEAVLSDFKAFLKTVNKEKIKKELEQDGDAN